MFLKTAIASLSIRSRLVVLFVFIFGTTTLVFSVFAYYFLNKSLLQDFDNALYNYSIDVSQSLEFGKIDTSFSDTLKADEGKIFPFPSGNALILLRNIDGKILIQSGQIDQFNPEFKKAISEISFGADSSYETITNTEQIPNAEAGSYRIITFPVDIEKSQRLYLQIAVPMATFETQLEQLELILIFGLPAVLLVAIVAGLFVASRALSPFQEIILRLEKIGVEQLSQRLPLPISNDEIKRLAEALNLMLERIENAFASQEKFIADASHQLLTPLTILKGEFELQKKTEPTNLFINSGLQEIDHLTKIIKDMLLLARIDSGFSELNFTEIFIDEIILEVISKLKKLTAAKNIQIKIDISELAERKKIKGEYDLLTNLFMNLIENAIKYSPPNGSIFIQIEWKIQTTKFSIQDFGPGITETMRPHLFKRFSRADTSSKSSGFGLGLAIAQKIALIHKTIIKLDPNYSSGSLFSVEFENSEPNVDI
jgi:signal transduction histidine kinase